MGLLSLDKPRPAGADYPAQSVGASGAFFAGYAPWEAVSLDDPDLKRMKLKLKGKLKTPHPRATDAESRGIKFPISNQQRGMVEWGYSW